MDAGRSTYRFSAVRGSSLSPLSMSMSSAGSDDRSSAAHFTDLPRSDIDWTLKYLTSDQPRSSPFTPITSRRVASRISGDIFAPSSCKSAGSGPKRMSNLRDDGSLIDYFLFAPIRYTSATSVVLTRIFCPPKNV